MSLDTTRARALVQAARADGRTSLHEHEGYALLDAAGLIVPFHLVVPASAEVSESDLDVVPADRVVVKAVADGLLHKSDVGAVAIGPRTAAFVNSAMQDMRERLAGTLLRSFVLASFVPHDASPGGEVLAGVRATPEFGPVVTLALGGTRAEWLSSRLVDDAAVAAVRPGTPSRRGLDEAAVVHLLTASMRGGAPRLARAAFDAWLQSLLELAAALPGLGIRECEMNPVVVSNGRLVALDALVTIGDAPVATAPRPLDKLGALLRPSRIAIVGVSEQLNPGRIILKNCLREGTPASAITVVKPGRDEIDGCRCVPAIADLPAAVDLMVVAVGAAQATAITEEVIARQAAESLVLIPGGFDEKDGAAPLASRVRAAIDGSRRTPWRGPLVVGGNCLGIRSRPGHYDTLFIPEHKLPSDPAEPDRLAVIAQSGAFAISRASRWAPLRPRYIVTTGNQSDVTIGDMLEGLADDPEIDVFAVYVEGFRPLDGARALDAVRRITARGASVVLYRAGRTQAGAKATASHTASIAGDYRLTRALFRDAGAMVAETIEAFDDLVALATRLARRPPAGRRVGAISNAGFECVAMADWLGGLTLAPLSEPTVRAVQEVLARLRVSEVVDVHNPLDLTPMTNDEGYEAVARLLLRDPGVDLGVIGCVPLTAALHTVPARDGIRDDLDSPDGIVERLGRLWLEGGTPWVAVVDSGALFDPMAASLGARGVPVFRTADRAMRALDAWAAAALAARPARANDQPGA
jgi:acyl-CoA synthetase (NDP forming)